MTGTTTDLAAVERAHRELAEEHRRLHGLVDALKAAADLPALTAATRDLAEALSSHFRNEERPGGLYDLMGACVPQHRERLSGLVDEHFRLLAEVRQLADRSRAALDAPFRELSEQAARVAGQLASHETREHELARAVLEP